MKRYYYLDRIQDFGVLWPVLLSSTSQELAQTEVFISTEVQARDPQVKTRLLEKGIAYQAAPSAWKRFLKPGLLVPGSEFITASESNAKPHRRTHAWVQYANKQKLHTITYQHGFENIGLTYSDSEFPCEQIRFESKEIRVWVCEKLLHKNISPETRKKIRFISRPFIQLFPDTSTETSKPIISVFENLHWSRYDDQYRKSFMKDLMEIANRHPEIQFILRPHIDQLWSELNFKFNVIPDNLILFKPDPNLTAFENTHQLLARSQAVITTPSTIAIDTAMLKKPIAITSYDLEMKIYSLVYQIYNQSHWEDVTKWIENQLHPMGFKDGAANFCCSVMFQVEPENTKKIEK